jgi:uncharacterized membrane protein
MPPPPRPCRRSLREILFRVSVLLKGADAVLEIAGGIALLVIGPDLILRAVAALTQEALVRDPRDLIANYALHLAGNLSVGSEHFAAFYLLSHGLVKIPLVVALLKRMLWAYPLAVAVFGGFVVYQVYRFSFTHSLALVALTVFDLVVIGLIWLEYRAKRRGAA